jgi:ubiquinone/menaquinone biosynthesis C-methylase UbiE
MPGPAVLRWGDASARWPWMGRRRSSQESGMDDRKRKEAEFHNVLRDPALLKDPELYHKLTANKKYYVVTRKSRTYYEEWLRSRCAGKRVLEYGCGNGSYSILAAQHGAEAVGIDISDVSVENARQAASRQGVGDKATFQVMDCESLTLPDDSFDIVCESGVLHHLDLNGALKEIARVVKPDGHVICAEALGHNPVIQLYRRLTPHLRTDWETEHILSKHDIFLARKWFERVDTRFFHLASLAAVPFRSTALFGPVLSVLEAADEVLLRLPVVKWQAWQVVYVLSGPRKGAGASGRPARS